MRSDKRSHVYLSKIYDKIQLQRPFSLLHRLSHFLVFFKVFSNPGSDFVVRQNFPSHNGHGFAGGNGEIKGSSGARSIGKAWCMVECVLLTGDAIHSMEARTRVSHVTCRAHAVKSACFVSLQDSYIPISVDPPPLTFGSKSQATGDPSVSMTVAYSEQIILLGLRSAYLFSLEVRVWCEQLHCCEGPAQSAAGLDRTPGSNTHISTERVQAVAVAAPSRQLTTLSFRASASSKVALRQ